MEELAVVSDCNVDEFAKEEDYQTINDHLQHQLGATCSFLRESSPQSQ
jgi:hypothetical protein